MAECNGHKFLTVDNWNGRVTWTVFVFSLRNNSHITPSSRSIESVISKKVQRSSAARLVTRTPQWQSGKLPYEIYSVPNTAKDSGLANIHTDCIFTSACSTLGLTGSMANNAGKEISSAYQVLSVEVIELRETRYIYIEARRLNQWLCSGSSEFDYQ
jgi:hypothetical protein